MPYLGEIMLCRLYFIVWSHTKNSSRNNFNLLRQVNSLDQWHVERWPADCSSTKLGQWNQATLNFSSTNLKTSHLMRLVYEQCVFVALTNLVWIASWIDLMKWRRNPENCPARSREQEVAQSSAAAREQACLICLLQPLKWPLIM